MPKTKLLSVDMQDLDTTVKSMMDTSQNMIRDGNCQKKAKICKICGKEGGATAIKNHIEVNHLEGVSIPCNLCDNTFRSRTYLIASVAVSLVQPRIFLMPSFWMTFSMCN